MRPLIKALCGAVILALSLPDQGTAATKITTKSLPGATATKAYSTVLTAEGGPTPFTWTVTSGTLPIGVLLTPDGSLGGLPLLSGSSSFTVKVVARNGDSDTQPLTLQVADAPTITTSNLPAGQVGNSYSQTLHVNGGTAPYDWSITVGALPAGLTLSGAQISRTPTTAGTSNFTVQVSDANAASATKPLSIAVASGPLSVTTTSLPGGQVGAAYSQALQASGGVDSYTWSINSGSLPSGLTLSSSGQITGT